MSARSDKTLDYEAVIEIVRAWPAPQRYALVQEVLTTLAPTILPPAEHESTLAQARGLLASSQPAPSDEDIAGLLDQRRQERYGL